VDLDRASNVKTLALALATMVMVFWLCLMAMIYMWGQHGL